MSLHLNAQKINGSSLKLSVSLTCAGDDLSGSSSMAASAETGEKPKKISVNCLIKFINANDLTDIVVLAEAKNNIGNREIYRVKNDTTAAMKVRKVKFEGDVSVIEDESLELWRVSFKLIEVQSIPELVEQRIKKQLVADISPAAKTVLSGEIEPEIVLSGAEKVLQNFENWVSDSDET